MKYVSVLPRFWFVVIIGIILSSCANKIAIHQTKKMETIAILHQKDGLNDTSKQYKAPNDLMPHQSISSNYFAIGNSFDKKPFTLQGRSKNSDLLKKHDGKIKHRLTSYVVLGNQQRIFKEEENEDQDDFWTSYMVYFIVLILCLLALVLFFYLLQMGVDFRYLVLGLVIFLLFLVLVKDIALSKNE